MAYFPSFLALEREEWSLAAWSKFFLHHLGAHSTLDSFFLHMHSTGLSLGFTSMNVAIELFLLVFAVLAFTYEGMIDWTWE